MAINEWWAVDAHQRFWMEITDREDLGADLFAPTADGSGRPYWGYELVTYVQPGDVVLHWHKTLAGEPGLVGWSQATGSYEDTDIAWQAHGTVGRAKGTLKPRPAWRMPLLNYTPLVTPVLLSQVRTHESELRQTLAALEATYPERKLYFPFGFSDKRELRAQQTYFVKMPSEALDVLGLAYLDHAVGPGLPAPGSAGQPTGKSGKRSGSGYIADPAVRSAIEWRAVDLAIAAYKAENYNVKYTGASKAYDLAVSRGTEVRRVEVKGSSGVAASVELTHGEVSNSRESTPTDLFVVDGIHWWREVDGTVRANGGDVRRWKDWTAQAASLKAVRFRYELPPGGGPDTSPA